VSLPNPAHALSVRSRAALALLAAAGLLAWAGPVAPARADTGQVNILQDDSLVLTNPGPTLAQARSLGAGMVRIMLRWQSVAPQTDSFHRPAFAATNPAAYGDAVWAPYDAAVRDATADGITVDLDLLGGGPLWATGPKMPRISGYPFHQWAPSAADYGRFVKAVAIRYSGNYDPQTDRLDPGNPDDLPRVHFWSVWNEPDYGPSLAPQAVPGSHDVEEAPRLYRALLDAAWSSLHDTGHGSDTIIWGELAPRGTITFGNFNGMTPLVFLRALYCVDAGYRPLRGSAAAQRGCPTTPAASRRFAAQHPALFHASGVSDHPYMRWYPPNREESAYQPPHFAQLLPNYTTLATIGHLTGALDRLVRIYGSRVRFPIWNTEFGYMTSGPKRRTKQSPYPYASQPVAAYYDNWAEYLSWRNPRLMSFDQYLLEDELPPMASNNWGGFASGLLNFRGKPKPGFAAWRMPLFLPETTAAGPGQALEVWGAVKPVHFALLDMPGTPQAADILFAPQGSHVYRRLATVPITSPEGYFDTRLRFPSSGTVIVSWTFPADPLLVDAGATVTSRAVQVSVK
jgi:hypothetical protein